MNIKKLLFLALLLLADKGLASDTTELQSPSWQMLYNWFAQPAALPPWQLRSQSGLVKLEASSAHFGGGDLYYRPQGSACMLSIPHQFHDMLTGEIGKAVFATQCQVMVINTEHRNAPSPDLYSMDYSHRPSGLHAAAAQAFARRYPAGHLYQLHGFAQDKRRTLQARQADFIISQGRQSTAALSQLRLCLSKLSVHTYQYPQQVSELGGTRNVMHRLGLPAGYFIHIEISRPMRERLVAQPDTLEQFALCLI
ncbi:hypothetical protein C3B51_15695 [Pseudoalteromonas rubra]|uniref:Uncharacterized protein n=1 Tax=Pseudoalteromonas rubra TaxID=43658 RepID=A0A4Q7E6J2_9GAMM|nr:hypothetical protein [Pseudoalteromonas rubra]RZM78115.1 hypothetical protein C3B51_15695 [Pseudoalteromonas rubra]